MMDSKLTLRSSDGHEFVVEKKAALMSTTLKNMVEDVSVPGVIPLSIVDGKTLAQVIEYCKKHVEDQVEEEDLKKFDDEFLKGLGFDDLLALILAANYLEVRKLFDLVAQWVADSIKGKQPEEIRKMLRIKNDLTKEEGEEFRRENAWAFD